MGIVICSDIHDNIWNLERFLQRLQREKVDALVFCGDFCAPFTLDQLAQGCSAPIHAVFGNNDGDRALLTRVAGNHPHVTLHGEFGQVRIGETRIAITHYPEIGKALARSSEFDLVCAGHTHRREYILFDEVAYVNPGDIMGRFGEPNYAMYDPESGVVDWERL